jgi:hypothetical protein
MQHHVSVSTVVCASFFNLRNNAYEICVDTHNEGLEAFFFINVTKKKVQE